MDLSLYVVLDRTASAGRDLEVILDATLAGGCRMIQLREKEWPSGRLLPLAERMRDRCRRAGADGVAVISAVCGAPDPAAATREFLAAIRAARDLTGRRPL